MPKKEREREKKPLRIHLFPSAERGFAAKFDGTFSPVQKGLYGVIKTFLCSVKLIKILEFLFLLARSA